MPEAAILCVAVKRARRPLHFNFNPQPPGAISTMFRRKAKPAKAKEVEFPINLEELG